MKPQEEEKCLNDLRKHIESAETKKPGVSGEAFERRREAYNELRDLLKMVRGPGLHGAESIERFKQMEYAFNEKKDDFLFTFGADNEIENFLRELHHKSCDIVLVNHRLYYSNSPATGTERDNFCKQEKELFTWFSDQVRDLPKRFAKYLALK